MFRAARILTLAAVAAAASGALADEKAAAPKPVRVAVYVDTGVSRGVDALVEQLAAREDLRVARVKAVEIRSGKLSEYDVLIHPGGSGGGQGKSLAEEGREKVRAFVRGGGGYVGICDYAWSLNILDAKVLDKAHWARGNGDVDLSLTAAGKSILGVKEDRRTLVYFQGPLLAPAGNPDVPDYEPLALYETEIAKKGAPTGVMIGSTAAASGKYGAGKVLCFSPHPEKREDTRSLLHQAIRWVADGR